MKQQKQTRKSSSWVLNLLVKVMEQDDVEKGSIVYQKGRWAIVNWCSFNSLLPHPLLPYPVALHCCLKERSKGRMVYIPRFGDVYYLDVYYLRTKVVCYTCNQIASPSFVTMCKLMDVQL